MVIRGKVYDDHLITIAGREENSSFQTPDISHYLRELVQNNPNSMADLYELTIDEIIDFLVELGKKLDTRTNPLTQEACRLSQFTSGLTPSIVDFNYSPEIFEMLYNRESLLAIANQVGVEINKKIVISTSCIIFVLIGVPIGIRFPRGGVNMVIGASSFVIGVYQIGLTNGEDWADRGLASPFWSMWAPSFLFLALGIFLLSRMGRWTAAVRGSGWREIWLGTRRLASRIPLRPGRRAPA